MLENRSSTIDILKGITIILVVIGHCIQYGSGNLVIKNSTFFDDSVFKFIYSFHMPLFMLISGFLYYNTICKYNTKQILKSRFTSFIIIIFSFSFIILLIELFPYKGLTLYNIIYKYLSISVNNFWYLWSVFFLSLLILFCKNFFNDNKLLYFIIYLVTFILPDNLLFYLHKYMYPYFLVGYFFNKYKLFNKINFNNKSIYICLFFIYSILLFNFKTNMYIYTSGYTVLHDRAIFFEQIYINIYRTIIGFIGSGFIILSMIYIKKILKKLKFDIFLSYIGKRSIGVYTISSIIFTYVLPRITYSFSNINYIYILIETFVILTICIFITNIIQKNKIANLLFLGKRKQ